MDYNKNFIIGVGSKARVGKDTLVNMFLQFFAAKNINAKRYAFADELKKELDPLFLLNAGISAFTEDPKDKALLRKTMIAWGTGFWREKDPDHWIQRLEQNINAAIPHIVCVSDVRFPNEAFWIKKNGGAFIHLDRLDGLGELFPPAGPDEAENDPILKEMADHKFIWESSNNNLSDCYYKGEQFFNEIFSQEQITTWQKDFPRI